MKITGIICLLAAGIGLLKLWITWFLSIEEKNRREQEALESMGVFYEQIREHIDQARKYRHDMPKHMRMVEEAISQRAGDHDREDFCSGKELLDTILFIKSRECEENGIIFDTCMQNVQWDLISGISIGKVEFAGLTQNLLDNAIEENLRIDRKKERKICFSFSLTEDGMEMNVRNHCADKVRPDFLTKKKDHKKHGYGVRIIREIAQSGGGNVSYLKENGEMTARVTLPYKASLKEGRSR